MNLGENIYRLRTEKNMSQGDLADALDVSRQSVSKWENNSATPELEKLLKMSDLFGITLDKLVGKEAPIPQAPTSPEIPAPPPMPTHRILGIILLCFGLLTFLILTLLGSFLLGYLIGLPLAAIGVICLTSRNHILFKCCWSLFALLFPVVSIFGYNFIRFDISSSITIAFLVILGALLLWTVIGIRNKRLSTGTKRVVLGCIVYILCVVLMLGFAFRLNADYTAAHSVEESMAAIPIETE